MNLFLATLAVYSLAAALSAAQQEFSWRGAVAAGQTIEVRNINGSIRAVESAGGTVEVVASKVGHRQDPADVKIEIVPHSGGVTICAVYPSRDPTRPNQCKPGGEGRMAVRNNDVAVDFVVRIPRGVNLSGNTVNGAVDARSIAGDVQAHTVNGKITVAAKGNVQAHTVNGSIQASMGDASWNGTREFSTVNGGITVDLPASASAQVKASTVNGSIHSEFPVSVKGKLSHRHMDAKLGSGGRELKLSTVNGSIQLRRNS